MGVTLTNCSYVDIHKLHILADRGVASLQLMEVHK